MNIMSYEKDSLIRLMIKKKLLILLSLLLFAFVITYTIIIYWKIH